MGGMPAVACSMKTDSVETQNLCLMQRWRAGSTLSKGLGYPSKTQVLHAFLTAWANPVHLAHDVNNAQMQVVLPVRIQPNGACIRRGPFTRVIRHNAINLGEMVDVLAAYVRGGSSKPLPYFPFTILTQTSSSSLQIPAKQQKDTFDN